MARPVKKPMDLWKQEILNAAQELFSAKGYEVTSIADIMEKAGGSKGLFYRFYQSKEEIMQALGDRMFFENNPFDAVKKRTDLNGLQKMKELLIVNQSDTKRNDMNLQAVSILKDPHILASAIKANRQVLTPLWLELLEEGKKDGSIKTEYTKELSELLPLINFWLLPSVFLANGEEIQHKFCFIIDVLAKMGLPLMDQDTIPLAEKLIADLSPDSQKEREISE